MTRKNSAGLGNLDLKQAAENGNVTEKKIR
jgi:hypothetical protein